MADYDFNDLFQMGGSVRSAGLLVERGPHGVRANVPHVIYHSPDGMNFGYAGSGPADLALSTLCALIPPPSVEDEERLEALDLTSQAAADVDDSLWSMTTPHGMRISRLAWRLHSAFKLTFITPMREDSAYIPADILLAWIEVQTRALMERAHEQ